MYCPNCGAELEDGAVFCGSCKTNIGGPASGAGKPGMELAGVGSRFGSYLIDSILIGVVLTIINMIGGFGLMGLAQGGSSNESLFVSLLIIIQIIDILLCVGYYTYFFGNGQTLGMKAVNIKLIRTDGNPEIGYWHGFLRYIGMLISALVLCLGYIWILIDENKQGWHDKIADVYVVSAR